MVRALETVHTDVHTFSKNHFLGIRGPKIDVFNENSKPIFVVRLLCFFYTEIYVRKYKWLVVNGILDGSIFVHSTLHNVEQ